MKFIKSIGLVIFIIGLIFTLYTGLGFSTREKVIDLGNVQITKEKEHKSSMSPLIGIAAMIIGGAVFIAGNKNRFIPLVRRRFNNKIQ